LFSSLSLSDAILHRVRRVRHQIERRHDTIVASSPQEFGAFIRAEIAKWGKLVGEAGIKAE
jgi:tripartite-type tricarboxylate transporter receptor subunit TctC